MQRDTLRRQFDAVVDCAWREANEPIVDAYARWESAFQALGRMLAEVVFHTLVYVAGASPSRVGEVFSCAHPAPRRPNPRHPSHPNSASYLETKTVLLPRSLVGQAI